MSDETKTPDATDELPASITFDYIKSNLFRIVHADGALGGAGPRNNIQINFFNERLPIPQREVYRVNKNQTLGAEDTQQRIARSGIVREVEVGVVLELSVARSLVKWLNRAIETAETLRKQRRDETKGGKDATS